MRSVAVGGWAAAGARLQTLNAWAHVVVPLTATSGRVIRGALPGGAGTGHSCSSSVPAERPLSARFQVTTTRCMFSRSDDALTPTVSATTARSLRGAQQEEGCLL